MVSKTEVEDFTREINLQRAQMLVVWNWVKEAWLLFKLGRCRGSGEICDRMLSIFPIKWAANSSIQSSSRSELVGPLRTELTVLNWILCLRNMLILSLWYGDKLDSKWSQMCKIRFTNVFNNFCIILGSHKCVFQSTNKYQAIWTHVKQFYKCTHHNLNKY